MRRLVLTAAVVLSLAGCGRNASSNGQPPTPGATTGSAAAGSATPHATTTPGGTTAVVWQLRYRLLRRYPDFAYCDPDIYPVARTDEQSAADRWWAGADHGSAEISTIMAQHGYREPLAGDQRLATYRDHKKLNVITMRPVPGGYEYELSTGTSGDRPDHTVVGVVTPSGDVRETSRQARPGGCPICLEAGTRIAAPGGDLPVALVRPGDLVWTTDANGRRVAVPVEQVVHRSTPGPHLMLRLVLSDGRVLVAAGGHPAADGTYLRQLHTGQRYDGATVVAVEWTQSTAPATVDILPAGPTGNYWANGILVGSTLKR